MRYLLPLLFTLPLLSCGFSKNYISSVPTIGEKTRGPIRIIREPELSIHLGPRNDLKTGEFNYIVLPVVPIGGNSDELFAQEQTKGKFVVTLSLYAHQEELFLNFSDIVLNLQQTNYKVLDVVRNPYAHYPDSQALRVGDSDVMCPKSQRFSAELFNKGVELTSNGIWECYDLKFPVDTPSPRLNFQIEVVVNDKKNGRLNSFQFPFAPYEWGHSDSFP